MNYLNDFSKLNNINALNNNNQIFNIDKLTTRKKNDLLNNNLKNVRFNKNNNNYLISFPEINLSPLNNRKINNNFEKYNLHSNEKNNSHEKFNFSNLLNKINNSNNNIKNDSLRTAFKNNLNNIQKIVSKEKNNINNNFNYKNNYSNNLIKKFSNENILPNSLTKKNYVNKFSFNQINNNNNNNNLFPYSNYLDSSINKINLINSNNKLNNNNLQNFINQIRPFSSINNINNNIISFKNESNSFSNKNNNYYLNNIFNIGKNNLKSFYGKKNLRPLSQLQKIQNNNLIPDFMNLNKNLNEIKSKKRNESDSNHYKNNNLRKFNENNLNNINFKNKILNPPNSYEKNFKNILNNKDYFYQIINNINISDKIKDEELFKSKISKKNLNKLLNLSDEKISELISILEKTPKNENNIINNSNNNILSRNIKNKNYNVYNNNNNSVLNDNKNIQNDFMKFSLKILSPLNINSKLLGIQKIEFYGNNDEQIPIENIEINSNQKENLNNLISNEIEQENKYYITEFFPNLTINIYISKKYEQNLNVIHLFNYPFIKDSNISPMKEIELYKNNNLIYKKSLIKGKNRIIIDISNQNLMDELFNNEDDFQKNSMLSTTLNHTMTINNLSSNSFIVKNNFDKFNLLRKEFKDNNNNNNLLKSSSNKKPTQNNFSNLYKNKLFSARIDNYKYNLSSSNYVQTTNFFNEDLSPKNKNLNNPLNSLNKTISLRNNNNINNNKNIKFSKIKFIIKENYGHRKFVGLSGIDFYDQFDNQINIPNLAKTIGADPKDIQNYYQEPSEKRIFENLFNGYNISNLDDNMWLTVFKKNEKFPCIEITFNNIITLSKIVFYNYNKKDELDMCTKIIDIFLDDKYYNNICLYQGIGEEIFNNNLENFGQEIFFPINNDFNLNLNYNEKLLFASYFYDQNYETPFNPSGYIIKIQLISNYYNTQNKMNNEIIGLNDIKLYNKNGKLINKNEYKLLYNSEIINDKNCLIFKYMNKKIIINDSLFEHNSIYLIFNKPVVLGFIEIKNYNTNEIKIYSDLLLIFEGYLNQNKPTIILFSSDSEILNSIDENYIINVNNQKRNLNLVEKYNYKALILN